MWEDPGKDTRRRLSVAEASDALGITVDAVRSRVKRGTMDHVRVGGRVYVLLGDDETRPGHDQGTDQVGDQGTSALEDRTAELIATLREQLAEEREARRRADTIIAQLARANEEQARTIRELEAPTEPPSEERESPETVEEEPERAEPRRDAMDTQEHSTEVLKTWTGDVQGARRQDAPDAQEGAQRPWWRRLFGV